MSIISASCVASEVKVTELVESPVVDTQSRYIVAVPFRGSGHP